MESMIRTFQISSDLFWGYRLIIDMSKFSDISTIIDYIKNDIRTFLLSRNLQCLVEKLDACKFHIHDPYSTYSDILKNTTSENVIYICDHC